MGTSSIAATYKKVDLTFSITSAVVYEMKRRTVSSSFLRKSSRRNARLTREQIEKAKDAIEFLASINFSGAREEMAGSASETGCSSTGEELLFHLIECIVYIQASIAK